LVQDEARKGEAESGVALPVVAVGVLAVSAAAIFIRLADAPALAIAFWRNALGVLVLLPLALYRRETFPRGWALWVEVASGVALGAHFGFWISSLDYTSVAASVVLVCTQPVFVAILAYLVFGERTSLLSFLGILVALAGTAVISTDGSVGSATFFGNMLAVIGACLGLRHVAARGCPLRRSALGVRGRDVVLAVGHSIGTPDHGPHRLQLGAPLRRSLDRLRHDTRRAGGLGASGVVDSRREAGLANHLRRRRRTRWPLPTFAWLPLSSERRSPGRIGRLGGAGG
jgi:uncharacterized membrane protein